MVTLADLILEARQKADMVNSTFIEDPEWKSYINDSYSELYDILVSRFEDYYSESMPFTLTASGQVQSPPADLYKIRGIDYIASSDRPITLRKFNFEERNRYQVQTTNIWRGTFKKSYRLMGNGIHILPAASAPGSYILWYIPRFTPLNDSTDVLGDVLDFKEYITVDAAIKALAKEESDVVVQMTQKQALKDRIEAMASNRDTQPERIADVRSSYGDEILYPWGY